MKSIDIVGKRNIDKILNIKEPIRRDTVNWKLDDIYYTHQKQIEIVNQLYLGNSIESHKLSKREINKKISGYKAQDVKKGIYDVNDFISLEDTIEHLMFSKLKCMYCKERCELLYTSVAAKKQWTLDRIDNNKGHTADNVVISCLECNVKRGNMDSDRFKRGKEIKIVRKQF